MKKTYAFMLGSFVTAITTFVIMYYYYHFSLSNSISSAITCSLMSMVVLVVRNKKAYQ